MPRKSAASNLVRLAATPTRSRPSAPSFLLNPEAALFDEAMAANGHLGVADVPTLAAWAQAMSKAHRLARQSDIGAWEKVMRITMSLSRSLRLTPQSQTHPETAHRKRQERPPSAYDMLDDIDDD